MVYPGSLKDGKRSRVGLQDITDEKILGEDYEREHQNSRERQSIRGISFINHQLES